MNRFYRRNFSVVGTLLRGYFNRDDAFEELLERYNDHFPLQEEISGRLEGVFGFINECGFRPNSRAWKKANLFTLIVEVDRCLNGQRKDIQSSFVVDVLEEFYSSAEESTLGA